MKRPFRLLGLALACLISLPILPAGAVTTPAGVEGSTLVAPSEEDWISRRGGSGRRGGGGRSRNRKSGRSRRSSRGASGFKSSGSSLSRGSRKPKGGWSNQTRSKDGPSLNRKSGYKNRKTSNNRNNKNRSSKGRKKNRNNRYDSRKGRRNDRYDYRRRRYDDRYKRRRNQWDKRYSRRWDRWDRYPGWARPGWGYARPWNHGWYGGWSSPRWGWWGASAAAWGITTLTTAAIINAAVDDAVDNHTTSIVVPNSDYRLLYGSVEPINEDSINFAIESGLNEVQIRADCKQGTLDGRLPGNAEEAELLNAACQVAFGSV